MRFLFPPCLALALTGAAAPAPDALPQDLGTRHAGVDWPRFLGPTGDGVCVIHAYAADGKLSGPASVKLIRPFPPGRTARPRRGGPAPLTDRLRRFAGPGVKARFLQTFFEESCVRPELLYALWLVFKYVERRQAGGRHGRGMGAGEGEGPGR